MSFAAVRVSNAFVINFPTVLYLYHDEALNMSISSKHKSFINNVCHTSGNNKQRRLVGTRRVNILECSRNISLCFVCDQAWTEVATVNKAIIKERNYPTTSCCPFLTFTMNTSRPSPELNYGLGCTKLVHCRKMISFAHAKDLRQALFCVLYIENFT